MKHIASILRLTIFFLMASTIGGCQLGKHYTRPQIEMPEVLDSLSMDSTSMGDFPWEELYTDTTLQALIRKTLEYNKDMLIAGARIKELAAMKRIDWANMFPAITNRIYAEEEEENYGGNNRKPDDQFDIKLGVSWELDLWGNLRWARDKSIADFMGSIENQRALKMSLIP